jgi:hypothetical protein
MIGAMTKGERCYLRRFACMLCEVPLDRDCCGSINGDFNSGCTAETRAKRRADCLKNYKPRKPRG